MNKNRDISELEARLEQSLQLFTAINIISCCLKHCTSVGQLSTKCLEHVVFWNFYRVKLAKTLDNYLVCTQGMHSSDCLPTPASHVLHLAERRCQEKSVFETEKATASAILYLDSRTSNSLHMSEINS